MTPQTTSSFNKVVTTPTITIDKEKSPHVLTISNLSVTRPDGALLIKPFSWTLDAGERLMISGASGCGKSTILRAAHGLWPWGSGHINTNADISKLIIAQKPHLPLLSLKGIVCFPNFMDKYDDDDVACAMTKAGMGRLIPEMNDKNKDGAYWERLSGGEKQRISFARILLHKPDLLMLDEVTASLDVKAQGELYSTLIAELPQTTIISISHRAELAQYHTRHAVIEDQEFKFLPQHNPHHDLKPGLTI